MFFTENILSVCVIFYLFFGEKKEEARTHLK